MSMLVRMIKRDKKELKKDKNWKGFIINNVLVLVAELYCKCTHTYIRLFHVPKELFHEICDKYNLKIQKKINSIKKH